jgi:hypothetical protein
MGKSNAVECLCNAVCQKYDDAFASIAEKYSTVSNQKKEAAEAEAMLN